MIRYVVLLLNLAITVPVLAQGTANVKLDYPVAETSTITVVTIDGVDIESSRISGGKQTVARIITDVPNPLIRGYRDTRPFPPVALTPVPPNAWILAGPPNSKWTVEVLSFDGARWLTEYVGVEFSGTPPPDNPPPDNPPSRDWSSATKWISEHPTPKADPGTARTWRAALKDILPRMIGIDRQQGKTEGEKLTEAQKLVGGARSKAFVERETFTVNWNPFLMDFDRRVLEQPPRNLQDYIALIEAIIKGLE